MGQHEVWGNTALTQGEVTARSQARAWRKVAALTTVSLIGIPMQWAALKLERHARSTIPWRYHRIVNGLMGIRRTVVGRPALERPLLIAATHTSWLDITVLSATLPVSFVAKSEVAGWPIFGLFAKLQRTIFVDRQRRSDTSRVSREMAERLADGDAIVLFAEGTSSNGNRVLPFRSALLGAAREAIASAGAERVWVQPVAITYTAWNGLPLTRRERPRLAWYGDMDLAPHLMRILREATVDVTVSFGDPIPVDPGTDRKAVARQAEEEVRRMMNAAQRRGGAA